MEKILITGGAGYIGSVLTEVLLSKGYQVTVIDSLMYNQISIFPFSHNPNFEFIQADVSQGDWNWKLDLEIEKADVIIPLAAIVGAPACNQNPILAKDVNYQQIVEIVAKIRNKDKKLIIPNTNSQYGTGEGIVTEESESKPLSLYAQTKCWAEECILESGNGIVLRLATVFGSSYRMRTDLLVNDFVYRALTDKVLVLFQSHFMRNYIHVRDVVAAFIFMIENYEECNGEVYNVGNTEANMNKSGLASIIKKEIPELTIIEEEIGEDPDKRNYWVSNEKIEKLGFKCEYSLERGIKELIKGYPMIINKNNKNFTNL